MAFARHLAAMGLGMSLLIAFGTMPLAAQDNPAAKKTAKADSPPPAASVQGTRRLPRYFGQVGISQEQRESIYTIQAKHQAQIESLAKQLADARAEMMRDCESALTDAQKQLLDQRRQAASKASKAKAQAAAPVKKAGAA
jgi:hypothetical protein